MSSTLSSGLNPAQQKAVEAQDGPTLIVAGPGSGKTRVLTQRIAHLIEQRNVLPYRIMAVTFTNKAAREMKERVGRIVGLSRADEVALGTFHSICGRLVRREAPTLGLDRNFVIYDSDDQQSIVKAVLAEINIDDKKFKPAAVHARISAQKNELVGPDAMKTPTYFDEITKRVYARYNSILRGNNAVDFDDLLMESVNLLRTHAPVRERMQERYLHVLVDEFQDTNIAQYEFVRLIAAHHGNIFAVGDMDQSVYSWRGADYRNVLRLREDYGGLNTIALEQNYRSTQTVLDAAMAVIKKNPNRIHVNLRTEKGAGTRIVIRELFNEDEEAQFVIDTLRELKKQAAATPGEVAVMYRTNAQSRALEDGFVRANMKYRLVGATRFYQRKEVKDALAYLRIINNPADAVSLKRIINVPARGIGEKSFEQLESTTRTASISCYDAITRSNLEGRGAKAIAAFGSQWQAWVTLKDEVKIGTLFDRMIKDTGLQAFYNDGTEEGQDRWGNIVELRNVCTAAGDTLLSEFLAELALVSETDNYDENADAPTLLTLHAAKGLEFKVVFLVGLNEGVMPHSRSLEDPEQMQEERRLMYVGLTRAKERLYLLRPFRRTSWGGNDYADASRFLADIPANLVDGMTKKPAQAASEMTRWTTTSSAPVTRAAPAGGVFKAGDRVYHERFGEGMVLRSQQMRDDEEVEVFFEGGGKKRLSAHISGLKKI